MLFLRKTTFKSYLLHNYKLWNKIFLTHWGRVTHICVGNLTIIGPDNGLSPGRRQAIIWTNARILLIGPLGTNFSENLIKILTFSFTKMRLKVSSAKWRPFCLGLNVLLVIHKSCALMCVDQLAALHSTYLSIWSMKLLTPVLTHWGRDKMAAFSQTTFSIAFFTMKLFEFRLYFHWSLFLRFELTIFQHWLR